MRKSRVAALALAAADPTPRGAGEANMVARARLCDVQRLAVARHLFAHGPTSRHDLAGHLHIPVGSLGTVLGCDWFEVDGGRYQLTTAGRQAARGATEGG